VRFPAGVVYIEDILLEGSAVITTTRVEELLAFVPVIRVRLGDEPVVLSDMPTISRRRIVEFITNRLNEIRNNPVEEEEEDDDVSDEFECELCGRQSPNAYDFTQRSEMLICFSCEEDWAWCGSCERDINTSTENYNWDYEECYQCYERRYSDWLQEWDFRPMLSFHPMPPQGAHPLYIGMELEVSWNYKQASMRWLDKHMPNHQDLLYAKEDSSVNNGFEVVTHPMQPDWALKNFPFSAFQDGIENFGMKLTDASTGTHIHMNKDAFTPAVLWKFLQIHMKLPEFCGIVGGRGTEAGFGSFNPRRHQGANFLGVDRRQLLEIAKKKGKFDNPERYVAVNLRNEYTLEMRYMRGGVAPKEIKKNIQWAKALYDFATYLDIQDVREGALANPGYLLWFINDHEDEWPELVNWISKEIPRPIALRERS
jgi:hypothetical protein